MDRETLKVVHLAGRLLCGPGLALQLQLSFAREHPEQYSERWMAYAMHIEHCKTCKAAATLQVA
jgi:hypothetical protein